MCLIFDHFDSRKKAERFATTVLTRFGLNATVHNSQQESNQIDPFPFQLDPPIVLVERPTLKQNYRNAVPDEPVLTPNSTPEEKQQCREALDRQIKFLVDHFFDPTPTVEDEITDLVTKFGGEYAGT